MAELEEGIVGLERELEALAAQLQEAGRAQAVERARELGEAYRRLESDLAAKMDEWEQLAAA